MYEFLPHTADVLVRVYGRTWEEVFETAAKAMFAVMVDIDKVAPKEEKEVRVEGKNIGDALRRFLEELLFLKDAEALVFSKFRVRLLMDDSVKVEATAIGERVKPEHNPRSDVKAVALHLFEVGEKDGRKYAQILFDV